MSLKCTRPSSEVSISNINIKVTRHKIMKFRRELDDISYQTQCKMDVNDHYKNIRLNTK